ncbi:MAG TPA: hypothetical protein VHF01_15295 [Candidatus Acidoferrum sp.]|nr:hypothetical protein [Candidatus Acidoferrum sp.]
MKVRRLSSVMGLLSVTGLLPLFIVAGAQAQDKSFSGCWRWPDSLDAVTADPQNHIVMYEDGNIRVLDVHTPPHTTNSKHDHQWLSVFLQDEAQPRGRDHGTDGTATQPGGEVPADAPFPALNVAGTQAPHAFENLDNFTKHFYRVEFKKVPFECPGKNGAMIFRKEAVQTLPEVKVASWSWPASMDAIITSQETDKVLFETYDMRFVEVTIRPNQKQDMGETLWPSALLFFEPQPKGVETSYDGKDIQVERKFEGAKFPMAIRMGSQPPHSFENKDNFPAHYYRVEFKKINYKA